MWEAGDEIPKRLDHLLNALGRLEILTRFPIALLDPLDSKAQCGGRRNRLSPNHIPVVRENENELNFNVTIIAFFRQSSVDNEGLVLPMKTFHIDTLHVHRNIFRRFIDFQT